MIDDAIKLQGKEFIKNAMEICNNCEYITTIAGIKRCSICCCVLWFKILSNKLITSKCPKGKW
jgi:hypothetical protein